MVAMKRSVLSGAVLGVMACVSAGMAGAACNATMNGHAMTLQECSLLVQVYGNVVPGNYVSDAAGNWINRDNPILYGNIYQDARNMYGGTYGTNPYVGQGGTVNGYGGSWGGGSVVSPSGVYDASGGCEGGSCVNILD